MNNKSMNFTAKRYFSHVEEVLRKASAGEVYPVYIFIGDRPIIHPQVNKLIDYLLPEEAKDFNFEILSAELFSEERLLELLETRGFFPGRKVVLVKDLPLLLSSDTTKISWKKAFAALKEGDIGQAKELISKLFSDLGIDPKEFKVGSHSQMKKILNWPEDLCIENLVEFLEEYREDLQYIKSVQTGSRNLIISWLAHGVDPSRTILIIESEVVDKRCSLYKELKKYGLIVTDLNKEKKDKKSGIDLARGFIKSLVEEKGKQIEPRAIETIIERVGHDDLVGIQSEVQKLISQAGNNIKIRTEDVCEMVIRCKDEELYKLTGAISEKDLDRCLKSLSYLLDQGMHPLAILKAIANFLRKIIILKAVFEYEPSFQSVEKPSYEQFRDKILSQIKDKMGDDTPSILKGHPYSIYKLSQHASSFDLDYMMDILASMAGIDLQLKGNRVSHRLLLEMLIFRILSKK
jgi:DNA polymerase-3 subunit delta